MRLGIAADGLRRETIDNLGVIRWFPSASLLTGLRANALGWRRIERERHQRLQDRLVFAARIDREPAGGVRMTDFQTAAINNTEQSWTTQGRPEGRGGGTYQNHLRYRDYFADMRVTVAPTPGTGTARSQRWTTWPKPCRSRPAPCSSGASRVSPQPRCTGKLSTPAPPWPLL